MIMIRIRTMRVYHTINTATVHRDFNFFTTDISTTLKLPKPKSPNTIEH